MVEQFMNEEAVETPSDTASYTYDQILGTKFKLVSSADYYEYDKEYKVWKDKTDNTAYMKKLVKNGEDLTIVGIVMPVPGATVAIAQHWYLLYAAADQACNRDGSASKIVKEQLAKEKINVFTGEVFGKENTDDTKFDMESLFSIDEDALREAFKIDESAFSIDLSSLSGIGGEMPDLSGSLNLDPSSMPDLSNLIKMDNLNLDFSDLMDGDKLIESIPADQVPDLADALSEVRFSFTENQITGLMQGLLVGYQESIKDKPEADPSKLQSAFSQYLSSEEVNKRLTSDIQELIKNNLKVEVSSEKLIQAAVRLMNQYQEFAKANGIEKADAESVLAFLSQDAVQQQNPAGGRNAE